MKVVVDFDMCESNAVCESLAPNVFEIDDNDYLVVKLEEIGPEDTEAVRRACFSCPRSAITLIEDED